MYVFVGLLSDVGGWGCDDGGGRVDGGEDSRGDGL